MNKTKEKIIREVLEDRDHWVCRLEYSYILMEAGYITKQWIFELRTELYATAEDVQEVQKKIDHEHNLQILKDTFMNCTQDQLIGIIENNVHLDPDERELFYQCCKDRGIDDIWELYYQSIGV